MKPPYSDAKTLLRLMLTARLAATAVALLPDRAPEQGTVDPR
jgi:hypothetical protein